MHEGKTVFSQLMSHLSWRQFEKCVARYDGDYCVKKFHCAEHFRVMAFAQLTYRESLRDIEICLRAAKTHLYHMGIGQAISRNNLSNANEVRDYRIYADFAQVLIRDATSLYQGDALSVDLDATVYALDASTIDLCLSLFPWAKFRKTKSAIKLHTLINLRGSIPEFIHISDGKMADVNALDLIFPVPGAYYIMDRGYIDFARLYILHLAHAFFVTRAKRNLKFRCRQSNPVDKSSGIVCDQLVILTGKDTRHAYPQLLRRIRYIDPITHKRLTFITNDIQLDALTIAALYKARWQVELFFKWIKQHLRIKAFYGTSENAVKVQIGTAVCTYLLVAIVKKTMKLDLSLHTMLQICSVNIFEKTPLLKLFNPFSDIPPMPIPANQLNLFD